MSNLRLGDIPDNLLDELRKKALEVIGHPEHGELFLLVSDIGGDGFLSQYGKVFLRDGLVNHALLKEANEKEGLSINRYA